MHQVSFLPGVTRPTCSCQVSEWVALTVLVVLALEYLLARLIMILEEAHRSLNLHWSVVELYSSAWGLLGSS